MTPVTVFVVLWLLLVLSPVALVVHLHRLERQIQRLDDEGLDLITRQLEQAGDLTGLAESAGVMPAAGVHERDPLLDDNTRKVLRRICESMWRKS